MKNLEAIPVTAKDLARIMIYSWVEFDGLMYLQQNPVEGIRLMIKEGKRLLGDAPLYGVCWNHWRTAENRTSIRYASLASIEGPLDPGLFYRRYGEALGIGSIDTYVSAMGALDETDNDARNNLFNIGFCYGGYWGRNPGLANYGMYPKENIDASVRNFESVLGSLEDCLRATSKARGKKYLEFLTNRISCTLLHIQSFEKMAGLQPLFKDKAPESFTEEDRRRVREVCDEALALQNEYLRLHAGMIEDRGCEGTLMSYYHSAPRLLNQIRKTYGGEGIEPGPPAKTSDAPPAPRGDQEEKGQEPRLISRHPSAAAAVIEHSRGRRGVHRLQPSR